MSSKSNYDIKLIDAIESEVGKDDSCFSIMPPSTLKSLLAKDLPIDKTLVWGKNKLPNIDGDYLSEMKLSVIHRLSGSESVILQHLTDTKWIYKLNYPPLKIPEIPRFNTWLLNIVLQGFLFPDFAYYDFKYIPWTDYPRIFMKQLTSKTEKGSFTAIKSAMEDAGWDFLPKYKSFHGVLFDEFEILISDFDNNNARVNSKGEVEGFDPKFILVYPN